MDPEFNSGTYQDDVPNSTFLLELAHLSDFG